MFKKIEKRTNYSKTAILLPGRGGKAEDMLKEYKDLPFRLIGIQPIDEWYPAPKSPYDQKDAINGLKTSSLKFDEYLRKLDINRSETALIGFSGGAVMAIHLAMTTDEPFAAVISHAGAILEPNMVENSKNETKYLLIHSKDDNCFKWDQRYLPMREAMLMKDYCIETIENEGINHSITDVNKSFDFLGRILGKFLS